MGPSVAEELASLPLLEQADAEQIERLAASMNMSKGPSGAVLGREGEPGDCFWLILSGLVSVTTGRRLLAKAGPGSILGELALLLRRPRTATVTALEDTNYLAGGPEALDLLLGIDDVRASLRRLVSLRLAEDARPVHAQLVDGTPVSIRPLLPEDRTGFNEAIRSLSADSRRRRFFSAGAPSPALVDYLLDLDYVEHFAWVALDRTGRRGLAAARYVLDHAGDAEVALTVIDEFQGRGLGTLMLGAVGVAANEAGVPRLVAHVMEDNVAMRSVFAKAGAVSRFDEPGVLLVTLDPLAAAQLLPSGLRSELAAAVHDIVTAATLALRS